MRKLTYHAASLISLVLPLSASAAIYDVTFSGAVYEYSDENFDFFQADSDFAYFDIFVDGQFRIDTGTAESTTFPNNWTDALDDLTVTVQDLGGGSGLFDILVLNNIVDDGSAGLFGNNVFVGSASTDNSANLYLQDFFTGNIDLTLFSAGPDFANSIGVFDAAAAGSVGDVFDLTGFFGDQSNGSFQTGAGEYYFDIQSMSMSVVPVPAAVWLFASALGMLGWLRRRV